MTTLLIAEHDHASLKDSTNKALTAAAALGADVHVLVAGGGEGTKAAADAAAKLRVKERELDTGSQNSVAPCRSMRNGFGHGWEGTTT